VKGAVQGFMQGVCLFIDIEDSVDDLLLISDSRWGLSK
jgi:hypothetical protein